MTDMGITGQILALLHHFPRFGENIDMLVKALPDQDVVATQKLTGLALPVPYLGTDKLDVPAIPVQPFLEPTFLETFFTLLPWQSVPYLDDTLDDLSLAFVGLLQGRDGHVIRLLSLRNLPQNNPRWGDDAKLVFSRFLGQVLDDVGSLLNL